MESLPAVLVLFGQSFGIAFSGAMMPGPLLTVTISETLKKGTRAGPFLVIGHGLIELALVTAVVLGLGVFLSRSLVIGIIGIVGGLVLIWMGASMGLGSQQAARQAISELDKSNAATSTGNFSSGLLRCILLGITTSAVNPYWTLWWVTVGLSLMTKALQIGPLAIGAFYVGHILADLAWYWAVAFTVSHGSHWLKVKAYRLVLMVCAVLLFGMGASFVISGSGILQQRADNPKTIAVYLHNTVGLLEAKR
jgi:threonine/homoserine/homoserine lactone efflux protein